MSDKKKVNTLTYLFLSDGRGLWHSPDFTKHHFRTKETTELVEIRKKNTWGMLFKHDEFFVLDVQ